MDISEINFRQVVFPLESQLLNVCGGDIAEFQKLIDTIGEMTYREDFSFCDVDRLITANKGYKKELNRSALNSRFLERILPLIKKCETCTDNEEKQMQLKILKYELHNSYFENVNEEDLINVNYAGEMLDSLLPMREMNVRVKFNEELETLKAYIVEKIKSRQTDYPSVGEGR